MKYAILFVALGISVCTFSIVNRGWAWLALWPGIALLAVGIIYGVQAHRFWGKGESGLVSPMRIALLAPYNGMLWLIWHGHRFQSRETVCDLVVTGTESAGPVWLGRWPFPHELPANTTLVIDLVAEWSARPGIAAGRVYRSFPILDGCAPREAEQFLSLVEEVARHPGTSYVHCAMGHGRSGLFAAAVMLHRGLASDADEAVMIVQHARPAVRLNPSQMAFLRGVAARLTGK